MRFKEFIHQTAKTTPAKKGGSITAKDIVNGAIFDVLKHGAHCTVEIIDASNHDDIVWKINSHGEERVDPIDEVLAVINYSEDADKQ